MRRPLLAFSAAAACLLPTAAVPGSDRDRLQGEWVMVSLEINGQDAAGDQVASARLVVDGDTYTPHFNDRLITETFVTHPGAAPAAIDFTYSDGPRKGETVKGIYKIEGDRYTMCRPLLADADRPTEFASKPGSGLVLVVWTRDTPAEQARRKAVEADRKALDGTWAGVSNRRDGRDVPEDEVRHVRLIITSDRYTLERPGSKASRGTNRIDPTRSPKTIDIAIIDGEYTGQTWLGIYEIKGDTYRSCFATAGKPRPTDFTSEPGSGNVLWSFRRESH